MRVPFPRAAEEKDIWLLYSRKGAEVKMGTYKLIGTKPNETPDETIIRCANNLVKAVLASGRSLHGTSGCSGFDIDFYNHRPDEVIIKNIISGWAVRGKTLLKITFAPDKPENDLTQDDAQELGK